MHYDWINIIPILFCLDFVNHLCIECPNVFPTPRWVGSQCLTSRAVAAAEGQFDAAFLATES